jgi:hypothetical protein
MLAERGSFAFLAHKSAADAAISRSTLDILIVVWSYPVLVLICTFTPKCM